MFKIITLFKYFSLLFNSIYFFDLFYSILLFVYSILLDFEASLGVKGSRIFNILPPDLTNLESVSVDTFKVVLDSFLANIPDQPTVSGSGRSAESNSLLHQIPQFMLNRQVGSC